MRKHKISEKDEILHELLYGYKPTGNRRNTVQGKRTNTQEYTNINQIPVNSHPIPQVRPQLNQILLK